MRFQQEFVPLALDELHDKAVLRKHGGWRFVQMCGVNTEEGIDLIYSYMKDGNLENDVVKAVKSGTPVPSITDEFLAAFVFENEAHDLFGVDIENIAIDFGGNFYQLGIREPMTIMSPEQKAAKDKAKKQAAAKAAKAKAAKVQASADAEVEAKLAGMDPEKAAKVRAAMEAKAKKAAKADASKNDSALEDKLAGMDPEKAAKVRAAMEAKARKERKAMTEETKMVEMSQETPTTLSSADAETVEVTEVPENTPVTEDTAANDERAREIAHETDEEVIRFRESSDE